MIKPEKIEVEKFKEVVKELFRGYPNYFYFGMVENVISESRINDLIKNEFFTKGKMFQNGKEVNAYCLGVNALPIVSAWETEELTRQIKILTLAVVILTALSVLISIISLFR